MNKNQQKCPWISVFLKALCLTLYCSFCIQHHLHDEMFADGTQVSYSESPKNYSDLVRSLQDCVKDIGLWMEENKFKLNNEAEAIRFSSSSSFNTTMPHPHTISLSNTDIEFSGTIRNLGSILIAIFQ